MTQERMPKQLNYQNIYEIFSRFREHEAEPKGELDHVNAFTLVVAVALSAQSTDLGVLIKLQRNFLRLLTHQKR